MSWASDYLAEGARKRVEALAKAEADARESGKELFNLRLLEAHLNRGSQARREEDHRMNYYILNPEMRTLAEYAQWLLQNEQWENSR